MRFFEKTFGWSVASVCALGVFFFLLQETLTLYIPLLPPLTENTLMTSLMQGALLALVLPWFFFVAYDEYWLTRALNAVECSNHIWRIYVRYWLGIMVVFGGVSLLLHRFDAGIQPVSVYWMIFFAALSWSGALLFAQQLKPSLRQGMVLGACLALYGVMALQWPGQWALSINACLVLLCGGTWWMWRRDQQREDDSLGSVDLSAFLFAPFRPLNPGFTGFKTLRRMGVMAQESYYGLLLLTLFVLPVFTLLSFPLVLGSWDEVIAVTDQWTLPLSPWLMTAIVLVQVPLFQFWRKRKEYWLTRALSTRAFLAANVGAQLVIYLTVVAIGALICQAFSGYVVALPFVLLVLYLFLLGPVAAVLLVGMSALGYAQHLTRLSWSLSQFAGLTGWLTGVMWSVAFVWWLFAGWLMVRSSFSYRSYFGGAVVTGCLSLGVLILSQGQSAAMQVLNFKNENPIYRQQWRIQYNVTNVLWLQVPVQNEPFALADAVLSLDEHPEVAVQYLVDDVLKAFPEPMHWRNMYSHNRQSTLRALQYWIGFLPRTAEVNAAVPFVFLLQDQPEQALAAAKAWFRQEQTLVAGTRLAFVQQVLFRERQALQTYRDLMVKFPESQGELLRLQAHLLLQSSQFTAAAQSFQGVREQGRTLSLDELQWTRLLQRPATLSESMPKYRIEKSRLYQRQLQEWSGYTPEQRLEKAQTWLYLTHNAPRVLNLFKSRLSAAQVQQLVAFSRELEVFVQASRAYGVLDSPRRPLDMIAPELWQSQAFRQALTTPLPLLDAFLSVRLEN